MRLYIFLLILLASCATKEEVLLEKTFNAHGTELLENVDLKFEYRGIGYRLFREKGMFQYERIQQDSTGKVIKDVFTNDSFIRYVDDQAQAVPDSMASKYSNSINSIAYFLFLPLALKDPAVQKEALPEIEIKGQVYETLKVTFKKEGGGKDFDDEYRYWINKEKGTMDYFAYNYQTDGGGMRFREAMNTRKIKGILFSDWKNYGFEDLNTPLDSLPSLFEQKKIPLVSTIENENINL